ncbi:MAG TPA: hypothetical protein DDX39_00060 [Bacteroidales bacterium]|nr:MAG: hypothetical protein A2W98_05225 [Bacteroidetes bacterium GWF2_33_38]OFY75379.1 MAG: hypothetical protein A2265_06490 [Bacteroidetes bacterium RIFOXYA12_FULL_33_9]OFY92176.1 MAG: hypothetical protein A2236_11935 [Bacteroidetes bacterium RIFOXYA2_FULL_33_7]HBF87003.1 hypothetical protein [Bacteroidales bacterium]
MIELLIGIDDTDNKDTRGTGFRSRQMAEIFINEGYDVLDVIRHQLYVHKDIPYTSHNSSACLHIFADNVQKVIKLSRDFLNEIAADGSDVGLCVATIDKVNHEIEEWGKNAKKIILTQKDARELAAKNNIFLEGLTGTHGGIIGALAAIGLRKWGSDGRCIWLKGKEIRDIKGVLQIKELKKIVKLDEIQTLSGKAVNDQDFINVNEWFRPIIRNDKIITFVESNKNKKNEWEIVSKDYIKSVSN